MKIILIFAISLFVMNFTLAQEVFLEKILALQFEVFKNDTVKIIRAEISEGTPSNFYVISTGYKISVKSVSGLEESKYDLPVSFTGTIVTKGEEPELRLNKSTQFVKIPITENSNVVEILHDDKVIYKYQIPRKPVCGNNICEENLGESTSTCLQDCPFRAERPVTIYIILALVLAVIVVMLVLRTKRTI